MRTYVAKGEEAEALKVGANWFVVDATNVVLGRLATRVARMLMGKDNPSFTPYLNSGDHVVVINADKVRMTGNKVEQKVYYSHSGYPGGLKEVPAKRLRESKSDWMIREAVLGMLPKNKLRARRAKKLRVYRDAAGLGPTNFPHVGVPSKWCLSGEQSERGVLRLRGAVSSIEISRRNIGFYGSAHRGHTNLVSGNGTAQGVGGARVPASGDRQVQDQRPHGRAIFSQPRVEA